MHRRTYLGAVGAAAIAGCVERVPGLGDSNTHLRPPDRTDWQPSHPIHGDPFPSFAVQDPLADEEVRSADIEGERSFLMTFIYTSCEEQCGTLVRLLQVVQEDAFEEGYEDDLDLLAMTFDPDTDDAAALREYGERFEVDLDAGNFRFLRPSTPEEAIGWIDGELGVPATLGDPGHHDHGDDDDHDHHHADSPLHYYIMFLVNERGITERAYYQILETPPADIIEDVQGVVG